MTAANPTPRRVEPDAVEVTRTFFAEHAGVLLTPDEAREANANIARLLDLLASWDQPERERRP